MPNFSHGCGSMYCLALCLLVAPPLKRIEHQSIVDRQRGPLDQRTAGSICTQLAQHQSDQSLKPPTIRERDERRPKESANNTSVKQITALGREALYSKDLWERYDAVRALGELEADATLPYLIAATADEDGNVISAAVAALGQRQDHSRTIVPLLVNLLDTDKGRSHALTPDFYTMRSVRCDVARALGQLGKDATLALPLLRRYAGINVDQDDVENDPAGKDWENAEVSRFEIQCALASARISGDNGGALQVLIDHLDDACLDIRCEATEAIGDMAPTRRIAVEALIDRLRKDNEWIVRAAAADALCQIGNNPNCERSNLIVESLYAALSDEETTVRGSAAQALARLEEQSTTFLKRVVAALEGTENAIDPFFHENLAEAMTTSVGEEQALAFLRDEFRVADSDERRVGIARIVSEFEGAKPRALLKTFIGQVDRKKLRKQLQDVFEDSKSDKLVNPLFELRNQEERRESTGNSPG